MYSTFSLPALFSLYTTPSFAVPPLLAGSIEATGRIAD